MTFYADVEGGAYLKDPTRGDTGEDTKTAAAAPNVIADDVLDWISRR